MGAEGGSALHTCSVSAGIRASSKKGVLLPIPSSPPAPQTKLRSSMQTAPDRPVFLFAKHPVSIKKGENRLSRKIAPKNPRNSPVGCRAKMPIRGHFRPGWVAGGCSCLLRSTDREDPLTVGGRSGKGGFCLFQPASARFQGDVLLFYFFYIPDSGQTSANLQLKHSRCEGRAGKSPYS